MKKVVQWISFATLVVLLSGFAAHEFRDDLFAGAMAFERGKAGLSAKTIKVEGMDIAYLDNAIADEEVVLLIHGFGAIKENWLRFAASVDGGHRVIALDLPGHGESVKSLDMNYAIDEQAQRVVAFLDALAIPRAHLVGNSMGGAISALISARYPDRVQTLTLIDPAGIYDYPAPLANYLEQGTNPLIVKSVDDFEFLLDFAMEQPPLIPWPVSKVVAERSIERKAIHAKVFSDLRKTPSFDFKQEIAQIQLPCLILWGSQDRVIDVKNGHVFKSLIPNSTLINYDEVGHAPMIEVPGQVAADVATFMQQHL
ncbi:alpha/beta fold superfamily hydrolase [Oleiphilus messinensis]|uniref:Alpha/beta fold superfamily hydrolase n=1 Tax=Oleiphilus messinensis TaxID=141451 RepID=A0A1Y0I3T1_9GAMM|nr:alpha/beta fold hydrolase [Oleiphilus messinensis]ARU55132.1 alpha/beta fold superfamily hydrolase [Oleiphilus messinensis]